jgi:hypothetical protein
MLISRILYANIKFNKSNKIIFEDYSFINNNLFYHLYYHKNNIINLNLNNKYFEIKTNNEYKINYNEIPIKILQDIDYYSFLNLNEININNDKNLILKNLISNLLNHNREDFNQLGFELIFTKKNDLLYSKFNNLSLLEKRHLDLIKQLL